MSFFINRQSGKHNRNTGESVSSTKFNEFVQEKCNGFTKLNIHFFLS